MARNWFAHEIRLTLFVADALNPGERFGFWEQVAGTPPDNDEFVRPQNLRRQIGPHNEGRTLELRIEPFRIDWILSAIPIASEPSLPKLGAWGDVAPAFVAQISRWATNQPLAYARLALAPTLFSPVTDRLDGYKTLVENVPSLAFDPSGNLNDILFQINRPVNSRAVSGLVINRVMRWQVSQVQSLVFDSAAKKANAGNTYHCQLDLDINTVPGSALDSASVVAIFDEFCDLAQAIALRGEQP